MKKLSIMLLVIMFAGTLLIGCKEEEDEPKIKDVEFTMVPEEDFPDALAAIIEEKKTGDMMLTYATDNELYIVRGYGTRPTSGYDVLVPECYLTENSIVFATRLMGPGEDENTTSLPSYPYVVIKTEYIELPVRFETQ